MWVQGGGVNCGDVDVEGWSVWIWGCGCGGVECVDTGVG